MRRTQDLQLLLLAAAIGILLVLAGCSSTPDHGPTAEQRASCPPLSNPPRRNDADAQTRRIAELEGWYLACREANLYPRAKRPAP